MENKVQQDPIPVNTGIGKTTSEEVTASAESNTPLETGDSTNTPADKTPTLIAKPKPAVIVPKNVAAAQKAPVKLGRLDTFLIPSKRDIDRKKYSKEKLADIDENLSRGYIKNDAIKDVDARHALHTLLTDNRKPSSLVPDAKSEVSIDVDIMRNNIADAKNNLSEDDQIRYGRALQIFERMKENDFKVMKGPGGTYWLESMENGKKVYASNGIREVAELVDKFNSYDPNDEKEVEARAPVETRPKELAKLVDKNDPLKDTFTDSERFHLLSMATDGASSLLGILGKATGVGAVAGAATSVFGGAVSLGFSMYADYLDKDVTPWEMAKNAGLRIGLEAMETVSILPLSVASSLKGASKAGQALRKGIHIYMMSGAVSEAVGGEWLRVINKKDSWNVDDYRTLSTMFQFVVGAIGAGANRKATKNTFKKQTQEANTNATEFSAKRKPSLTEDNKPQVEKVKKIIEDGSVQRINKIKVETAAAETKLIANNKAEKSKLRQDKKKELAVAAVPPKVGPNGQLVMDFDAPVTPTKKELDKKYRNKSKEVSKALIAKKDAVKKVEQEKINTVNENKKALAERVDKRYSDKEDTQVASELTIKRAVGKENLDKAHTKAVNEHGEIIANRLRARGEKKSGVPEAEIESTRGSKASEKRVSKLDGYKKEKADLEDKLKDVEVDKRSKEDVERLEKLGEDIASEVKKTKGIRGAGNKLIAKTGNGARSTSKFIGKKARQVEALSSLVAVSDGVSGRALSRSAIYGEKMDDVTGNRHYEYDLKTARKRLLDEGYEESEIRKYTLQQLRGALRKIEKGRIPPEGEKWPKQSLQIGGRVHMYQIGAKIGKQNAGVAGGFIGSITDWVSSWFSDPVSPKPKPVSVRPKAVVTKPVVVTKPKDYLGKLVDTAIKDVASKGDVNNFDVIDETTKKIEEIKADPVIPVEDKEALLAKYRDILDKAKKLQLTPDNKFRLNELAALVSDFKVSDLYGRNRLIIERPITEDISAPIINAAGVYNMPGYNEALNRTSLIPKIDTADSFAANTMNRAYFNDGEKRRSELVARNAEFVENSRANDRAVVNRNNETAVNAQNMNIQRKNAERTNYAAQLTQAEAERQTYENQRKGRLGNALMSGLRKVYVNKQSQAIKDQFNKASSLKSRWNNEYKPRFDAAILANNPEEVAKVKSEFITANEYNPDDLDEYMAGLKTQYENII